MRLEDVEKLLAIIDDSHFTEINLQVGDVQLFARKGGGESDRPTANGASEWSPDAATEAGAAVLPAPEAAEPVTPTAPALNPPAPDAAGTTPSGPAAASEDEGLLVRAPMLGVFYRAPAPGSEPFAVEGQEVSAHDTLASIEVMKLFSSIPAGIDGTLVRFLVENGALVEYNQPLAVVRPHAS